MEPLTLILTALITGASKAAGEEIPDGYKALKELIKRKFESQGKGEDADDILKRTEKKPESKATQELLKEELETVEADKDQEIIQAAQKLLEKEDPQGTTAGKYVITGQAKVGNAGDNYRKQDIKF